MKKSLFLNSDLCTGCLSCQATCAAERGGGAGARLENPDDSHHYLLCRVDSDGNLTVQKKDVPAEPRRDYPEYVARAKLGREALRALSAALLLIGVSYGWFVSRRSAQER